jgi:hypothetical protein
MLNNIDGIAKSFGIQFEDIGKRLGASKPRHVPKGVTLPSSFDARTTWSTCIHDVRDQ